MIVEQVNAYGGAVVSVDPPMIAKAGQSLEISTDDDGNVTALRRYARDGKLKETRTFNP